MTSDQYVRSILRKYDVSRGGAFHPLLQVAWPIGRELGAALGSRLARTELSGSHSKGTAVLGGTDVDIFMSFSADPSYPLRDIYQDVFGVAKAKGWNPRKQTVSIRIQYNDWSVDLVPGRRQPNSWRGDHWLYRNRVGSWQQTNVGVHASTVKKSMRAGEIQALKIWRNIHNLDFPSFYLELTVIQALAGSGSYFLDVDKNIVRVFQYLSERFEQARVVDPANSNNVISEDLNAQEKATIAEAARRALTANWSEVIW
jgi:hypothetical protein